MKLWGGRFTKEENQLVHNFNESLSFDRKLYRHDIEGSIAHVSMLARQGIVSEEDQGVLVKGGWPEGSFGTWVICGLVWFCVCVMLWFWLCAFWRGRISEIFRRCVCRRRICLCGAPGFQSR